MKLLQQINSSIFYWLVMAVGAIGLEGVALYYQYVIGEEPCVVCIQVRIWIMAYIIIGFVGSAIRENLIALRSMNVLGVITSVGLFERSYYLLGVERLWDLDGSCDMTAGLPWWFDLEKWFPAIFEVKMPCGFTPYIFFKISMAEILFAISISAVLATLALTVSAFTRRK